MRHVLEARKSGTPCFFVLIPTIKYYYLMISSTSRKVVDCVSEFFWHSNTNLTKQIPKLFEFCFSSAVYYSTNWMYKLCMFPKSGNIYPIYGGPGGRAPLPTNICSI